MTRVYLDPTALTLPSSGADQGAHHVAPGAADAVTRLIDAGFDVVVLGDAAGGPLHELPAVTREATLPEHLDDDAWFLTGDSYPSFGRPRGGTTVLVGPRRPVGKVPLPRFDLETRDMASAAMEILTRQAMD